jgi:hypothetical protein
MCSLIKRTFVVRYRRTGQGLQTVVIKEVKVKPLVSPQRADDQPQQSSPVCVHPHKFYEEDCSGRWTTSQNDHGLKNKAEK